jgi:hypothetical protein
MARKPLNFGMPDARKPHLSQVAFGPTIGFRKEGLLLLRSGYDPLKS